MKKFLTTLMCVLAGVCFVLGGGARVFDENIADAANTSFYVVYLDYNEKVFDIEFMSYTIDGIVVEYNHKGEEIDGVTYYYKAQFFGESKGMNLMTGEARTEYFEEQPFTAQVSAAYTIENGYITADAMTDVRLTLKFSSENMYRNYRLSSIEYRQAMSGAYTEIDSTQVDKFGDSTFKSEEDGGNGYHSTGFYNSYKFLYDLDKDVFDMTIQQVPSDMSLRVNYQTKAMKIEFTGDGADIGESNRNSFSYSDSAKINVTPNSANGQIVKTVKFVFGDTEIFTVFGGMYSDGNYYFADGVDTTNVISYGNFALAIVSDYDYIKGESDGNYASFVVNNLVEVVPEIDPDNPPTEPLEPVFEERTLGELEKVEIRLDDAGGIFITTPVVPMMITVDITTQKYAQIDLFQVLDENNEKLTSVPFESVEMAGVVYPIGEDPIPERIFKVGFSDTIAIKVGLKDGYNFAEYVDPLLILGKVFEHGAYAGGRLSIGAVKENTCNINVYLYKGGELFADSATKIYLSTRDDIESSADFVLSDLSAASSEGRASIRGVDKGDKLKIYVVVSQYYCLTVGGETFAGKYLDLDYTVTENANIIIDVSFFSVERPVMMAGDEIGTIKISLYEIASFVKPDGTTGISAGYTADFKPIGGDSFTTIRTNNPYVYGFTLVNMAVNGVDFLTKFADETFGIDRQNVEIHKLIANELFGVPGNGLSIVARFTEKKNEFSYNFGGDTHKGFAYYGKTQMYLQIPVTSDNPGLYFAGLYYSAGGNRVELLTVEDQTPEVMEDGEFEGYTKYELITPWNLDDSGMLLTVIISPRNFEATIVTTSSETEFEEIVVNVKFGDMLTVSANVPEEKTPVYKTGYNLIGWAIAEEPTTNFVIDTDFNGDVYEYHQSFGYEWVNDIRIVPVFSAGTAMISVMVEGMEPYSVSVRFDEVVDLEKLFKRDETWVEPEKFGYDFLGFFDTETESGNHLFEYVGGQDIYEGKFSENPDYFGLDSTEGTYVWKILSNIQIYGVFREIEYNLTLTLGNPKLSGAPASDTGSLTKIDEYNYYLSGFTILDTLTISGLAPRENYFISSVNLTILLADGETIPIDTTFAAECASDGVVATSVNDGRIDEENWSLIIVVGDFVNPDTNGAEILVEIEYEAVTYIVSFSGTMVTDEGKTLYTAADEPTYYKMEVQYANVEFVDHWMMVDAYGNPLGANGWNDLIVEDLEIDYPERTLFGISGLNYEYGGITYSFKAWKDVGKDITLSIDTDIRGAYEFVAMFSDKYDVSINYYVYNDASRKYVKLGVDGYFWTYDVMEGSYILDGPKLVNSYEIFLIGGKLYYISGWCNAEITEFGVVPDGASVYPLMSEIAVDYESSALEIDFYADYDEYKYEVTEDADAYYITANLPNDANGNAYNVDEVLWVTVDKARYDSYSELPLSVADKLSIIFGSSQAIQLDTITSGSMMSKQNSVPDDCYLFAVVERKVDGLLNGNLYVAVKVN